MAESPEHPRDADEWRVEVHLDEEAVSNSLGDRLSALHFDDEARKRLGGSVIVTRDGSKLFLYTWHEQGAREAEGMVRDLIEEDGLAAEVQLARWHPVEDTWRPASEPLPASKEDRRQERHRHLDAGAREFEETARYEWDVVVDLPDLVSTFELSHKLDKKGLPVKRRWKYLLVGALTEENAIALGKEIEELAPDGSIVAVRPNPHSLPTPAFVFLSGLKPRGARDLGL